MQQEGLKQKNSRHAPGVLLSALHEAHDIFGDVDELLKLWEIRLEKMGSISNKETVGWKENRLEDEFEPSILSEKYITKQDDEVRDAYDLERMHVNIKGPSL